MPNYLVSFFHASSLAFLITVWQTGGAPRVWFMQHVIRRPCMKLYGLKNCDSCKKALSQLRATGHDIEFFDIRTNPLDQSQIIDLLARHGDQFVLNRKSTTWRNLADPDRLLSPENLLALHPTLIKRPVIFYRDISYVGWTQDVQTACGIR
tara:strand:- start:133 stop:585 length:453 start_codon:yes stop_codon:yes gene_type:complete